MKKQKISVLLSAIAVVPGIAATLLFMLFEMVSGSYYTVGTFTRDFSYTGFHYLYGGFWPGNLLVIGVCLLLGLAMLFPLIFRRKKVFPIISAVLFAAMSVLCFGIVQFITYIEVAKAAPSLLCTVCAILFMFCADLEIIAALFRQKKEETFCASTVSA